MFLNNIIVGPIVFVKKGLTGLANEYSNER